MMKRNIHLALSAVVMLLGLSAPSASASTTPNAPVLSSASEESEINTRPESATTTVSWTASVVDAGHDYPRSYEVKFVSGGVTKTFSVARSGTIASYAVPLTGGLVGGTTYSVTVVALSAFDTSTSVSNSKSVTLKTAPALPGSLAGQAAKQSAILSWAAPGNTGGEAITGYVIKNVGTGETITVSNPALTSYTVGNLTPGNTVNFQIAAKNRLGLGQFATYDGILIPALPIAPVKPVLTNGSTSITASWVAVTATSPVTGYKVYLRDMSKPAPETATVTTSTTVTFDSLTAGSSYTVRVLATNLAGDGPLSETSSVKTLPAATNLTANAPVFSPDPLPDLVIGGTTTINVTAPSGGTPTIAVSATPSGACTYNGTSKVVTAVALGTCTLTATIAQTSSYAQGITLKTFTITKTLQTITFPSISNQPLPGPLTVSATSTSGLIVTFTASDNCTVIGNTVSFTSTGSCTVNADQAGNISYEPAPTVRRTFIITPANSNNSSGGNSGGNNGGNSGGSIGGGGGGVGTTWFNLFMADPDNLATAYSGIGCAVFIFKSSDGDKSSGQICATKSGALDYEANDGNYVIRTYDKENPSAFKEYQAKVTFGTFEVVGAGFRGGSVPRRVITILKKGEMPVIVPSPAPTPSPIATTTPKPAPSPSSSSLPTVKPSPVALQKGFVVGGKISGALRPSTLISANTNVAMKLSANFQAVIPSVKKGEKLTMVVKDPKGKSFTVAKVTATRAGTVKLPSIKFSVSGKYTITIKVGTKTKIVALTATK